MQEMLLIIRAVELIHATICNFSFRMVKSGEVKKICLFLYTPTSFRDLLEGLRMNEWAQHLEGTEQ